MVIVTLVLRDINDIIQQIKISLKYKTANITKLFFVIIIIIFFLDA